MGWRGAKGKACVERVGYRDAGEPKGTRRRLPSHDHRAEGRFRTDHAKSSRSLGPLLCAASAMTGTTAWINKSMRVTSASGHPFR